MSAANNSGESKLSQNQWSLLAVPAIILLVMAILQVIGFGSFKDWLKEIGVGWSVFVAIVVIIAEVWGALSLLQINMSKTLRAWGVAVGVLVSGFWFIETMQLATTGTSGQLPNSGFFGKYLTQTPGWWTVLEVAILLFWVVYSAELLKKPGRN